MSTVNCLKALWLKDRLILQRLVLGYSSALVLTSFFLLLPGSQTSGMVTSIVLLTLFTAYFCHLTLTVTIVETKKKSWALLKSLPISPKLLFFSRLFSTWLAFGVVWLFAMACITVFITQNHFQPAMLLSLYVLIFSIYPAAFSVILATGLITQSNSFTLFALVLSNAVSTIAISAMGNNVEISNGFAQGSFHEIGWIWPSWGNAVISTSLILIAGSLTASILVGTLKKHY